MKIQKVAQVKGVFSPLVRTKLSPKIAYKLLKFIKALEFDENFFNSKLREIVNEYAEKDEKGKLRADEKGNIVVSEDKQEAFKKAIDELNDIEVTTPDIKFTLDELQGLTLSVVDMSIIEDFIKEE